MASITDICNAAISHCGTRSKISSIGEGSAEANSCLAHFAILRDAMLRAADWNFARRTVTLGLISVPNPQGLSPAPTSSVARWLYEYAVPTDCLRLRRLNDEPLALLPESFYELASDVDSTGANINVLFCNWSGVAAIYTASVVDPLRWDAGFVDAMAIGLAARICFELTGKPDRAKELLQIWAQSMRDAASHAANEGSNEQRQFVPEALQARGFDDGLAEIGQTWPRW